MFVLQIIFFQTYLPIHFLNNFFFLDAKKFNLEESNFFSYMVNVCVLFKKTLLNFRSYRFCPILKSLNFWLLSSGSDPSWINGCLWCEVVAKVLFFSSLWIFSCASATCYKDLCFLIRLFWSLCENQMASK